MSTEYSFWGSNLGFIYNCSPYDASHTKVSTELHTSPQTLYIPSPGTHQCLLRCNQFATTHPINIQFRPSVLFVNNTPSPSLSLIYSFETHTGSESMAGLVVIFDFDKTIIDCDSDNWVVEELGINDLFTQLLHTLPWNSLMVSHCSTSLIFWLFN